MSKRKPEEVLEAAQILFGEDYKYIAQDADGRVYTFKTKPKQDLNSWIEQEDNKYYLAGKDNVDWGTEDWKEKIYPEPPTKHYIQTPHYNIEVYKDVAAFSYGCLPKTYVDRETLKKVCELMEDL